MTILKKSISVLMLGFMSFSPLAVKATDTGFLQAAVNMASLENYKSIESFYGNMVIEGVGVNYRFNFTSAVDNDVTPASSSRFNLTLGIVNQSGLETALPFKQMNADLSGQLVTLGQEDIYFRLDEMALNYQEPAADMQPMLDMLKSMIAEYQGKWYKWSMDSLLSDMNETSPELFDQESLMTFNQEFKTDPELAVTNLIQDMVVSTGEELTAEDKVSIEKAVELFFQTSFFIQKDVLYGNNAGFKFFTLNRATVASYVQEVGELTGDPMTLEEELALKDGLSKMSVAGIYRINDKDLLDNLVVRMKLKDIEGLDQFEMNYRFKLTDTVNKNAVQAPATFEDLSLPATEL